MILLNQDEIYMLRAVDPTGLRDYALSASTEVARLSEALRWLRLLANAAAFDQNREGYGRLIRGVREATRCICGPDSTGEAPDERPDCLSYPHDTEVEA